eukprot:gene11476-34192_t
MLASKVSVPCACSSRKGVAPRARTPTRVQGLGAAPVLSRRAHTVQLAESRLVTKAVAENDTGPSAASSSNDAWVPVCAPEDLPKGARKEFDIDGRQIIVFWYRNQIYAIQSRSPAEGAYSPGFMTAKFTQDYAIECPGTGSLFSLKDGSIMSWYPNNPVLRALTPIYPVKLSQEAIYVDVSDSARASMFRDKGGADTSLENNNVFSVMPTVYFEGMDPSVEAANLMEQPVVREKITPAIALITIGTLAATGVSGTLVCIYFENLTLLAAFWLALGSFVAVQGYKYLNPKEQK